MVRSFNSSSDIAKVLLNVQKESKEIKLNKEHVQPIDLSARIANKFT